MGCSSITSSRLMESSSTSFSITCWHHITHTHTVRSRIMSLHPTMQSPGPTWCGLLYNSWIWLQMNCRPISEALSVMGCWMLRSSLWLGFEDLLPRQASGQKALVSSTTTRSLDNWGEVRGGRCGGVYGVYILDELIVVSYILFAQSLVFY